MNNRKKGSYYEEIATDFLQKKKVRVVARNFRCRQGEIDIIGYDGPCLVFFEVKAREHGAGGYAGESLHLSKQRKICRVADFYRYIKGVSEFEETRYDCILIDGEELLWVKDAFCHIR
ncbi:MAG: YraN family protein [Lachnospiraceae bacterium]